MQNTKSISVIIPTYNGKELLKQYLPSCIRALEFSTLIFEYEIIVVDDCSKDDTITFLKNEYPQIILLKNETNLGFSKTINKGIRYSKMDLSLLLNNDMELPEDYFEKTIPFFIGNQNLFGVSSQIRDKSGKNVLEGAKKLQRKHGMFHYKDCLESSLGRTLYVCGGNALVDSVKLKMLGGFNELFSPFYFEDFDLSLRAWRNGWNLLYTDQTYCKHCHSTTILKENNKEDVERIFLRNKILINYLNNSKMDNFKMTFYLSVKFLLSYIAPSKSKLAYRNGMKDFFKLYKDAKRLRQKEYVILPLLEENLF